MIACSPKVFLIGGTELYEDEVAAWLTHLGGEAVLNHIDGTDGEKLIELAGRRCYNSFVVGLNPNVTKIRKDSSEYLHNILKSEHGSVLEHTFTNWAIEDVSRIYTHELVRHRSGTSFSQESLRYVRLNKIKFWKPPEVEENPRANELFNKVVLDLEKAQLELAKIYNIDDHGMAFSLKKKYTSAFRRIAPEGLATGIVLGCNIRALRWLIQMRTTIHAEVEIRKVFIDIFDKASKKWPMLFQDFEKIDSGDGLFECVPKYKKV